MSDSRINFPVMESSSVASVLIVIFIETDSFFFRKVETLVNSRQWFLNFVDLKKIVTTD